MKRALALIPAIGFTLPLLAQPSAPPSNPQDRTRWFREAKFGMFIHWGVYAVIGRHEWARENLQIPQAEYDKYARRFNPVNFNADRWVDIAANAGARYMVITSKHHDGFSIYRSKVSDYDMEITPYKGDPLKMLAEAARRKNMRLGFYHSVMDWHHPDYIPKREWEIPGQKRGGNIDKYLEFMKTQLRELLTEYGPVAMIWFDGEWEHTRAEIHSDDITDFIRTLSPATLINDRLYRATTDTEGRYRLAAKADFGTPEQFVPATGVQDASGKPVLWESCVTINTDSWGYNQYETEFKTKRDLVRMLIEVVSKGGNLLLNVGPTPDGRIPEDFVTRLNAMGEWMKVNSEAIYSTEASPFARLPFFGRATRKGNTLYLHVFQWPQNRELRVPGLKNTIRSARILGTSARPATKRDGPDVIVDLPAEPPDETASVVALELDGPPSVEPFVIRPGAKGEFYLGVESSEIETRFEQRAKKENILGRVYLTRWVRADDVPSWNINVGRAGRYQVFITYGAAAASDGTPFTVSAGNSSATGKVVRTARDQVFREFPVGEIRLEAGEQTVRIKPATQRGAPAMNLVSLRFAPLE